MRLLQALAILCLAIAAGMRAWDTLKPADYAPRGGLPASPPLAFVSTPEMGQAPEQGPCEPHKWGRQDYTIIAQAAYCVTGRVASTRSYSFEKDADLVPYDFVLAWGKGLDPKILDALNIEQFGRWFTWHTTKTPPITAADIMISMANTHLIPRSAEVLSKIKSINSGDLVRISGYLVNVSNEQGFQWRSSLTRNDTGGGACELMWVDEIEVLPESAYRDRHIDSN